MLTTIISNVMQIFIVVNQYDNFTVMTKTTNSYEILLSLLNNFKTTKIYYLFYFRYNLLTLILIHIYFSSVLLVYTCTYFVLDCQQLIYYSIHQNSILPSRYTCIQMNYFTPNMEVDALPPICMSNTHPHSVLYIA